MHNKITDFLKYMLRRTAAGMLAGAVAFAAACPAAAADPTVQVSAPAALLMEPVNRQILYEKNMDETMYPASITKLMTALLTMENADPEDTMTLSYEATHSIEPGCSHIALTEEENISVRDCLYAMMLPSANDAANGLAEHIAGSLADFPAMMNERAKELGAENTHFVNANGLHDPDHYTTAHDIALIACEAMEYPEFCEVWGTMQHDIPPTNKNVERNLWSQIRMLNETGNFYYEPCTGGKLGWTPEAKNTCVLAAEKNGVQLLCVLMGQSSVKEMFREAENLFEYGFQHLKPVEMKSEAYQNYVVDGFDSAGNKVGEMTFGYDFTVLVDDTADMTSVKLDWNLPEKPLMGETDGVSVTVTLENAGRSGQLTDLGTFPAELVEQKSMPAETVPPEQEQPHKGMHPVLKWALILLGGAAGVFLLLLAYCWITVQKKKREIANKRRAMAARGTLPRQNNSGRVFTGRPNGRK